MWKLLQRTILSLIKFRLVENHFFIIYKKHLQICLPVGQILDSTQIFSLNFLKQKRFSGCIS